MELRPLPIEKSQRKGYRERHHVKERNDHKLGSIGATFLHSESCHCNCGRDANDRNRDTERKAKPAELLVKLYISG